MQQIPVALESGVPLSVTPARILCIPQEGAPAPSDVVGYVGGVAMLPVGMEMPTILGTYVNEGETETLSHLATFSTAVLSDVAPDLPAGDLVLLFATQDQPWSYVSHGSDGDRVTAPMSSMRDAHRVVFIPAGTQTVAVEGRTTYPRRDVVAVDGQILDLANEDDYILKLTDADFDELDDVCDTIRSVSFGDYHEAIIVQGPIENIQQEILPLLPELGEVVRGLNDTNPDDWLCIAQVETLGSYHEPKVEGSYAFGDEGILYYCITRADLAAMRFDRTICILQCG